MPATQTQTKKPAKKKSAGKKTGGSQTRRNAETTAARPRKSAAKNGPVTKKKATARRAKSRVVSPTGAKRKAVARAAVPSVVISANERQRMIAEAAYFLAENRGSDDGDPRQDWIAAEAEIDAKLIGITIRED